MCKNLTQLIIFLFVLLSGCEEASNNYAKVYGIRLRPELYEKYNPIPSRKDAEEIEEMLGKELRKKGVGVWYN